MSTPFFCSPQAQTRKNGRRICPINNDLTPVDTWGTPLNGPFPGGRHDA
jgi:hypothetical protein